MKSFLIWADFHAFIIGIVSWAHGGRELFLGAIAGAFLIGFIYDWKL